MHSDERSGRERLVALAREGRIEAIGQLLEPYRPYLKVLAELQIDERFQAKLDASDVVQETFLSAHQKFADFRGTTERELMAWLRQILASNLADQVWRRYGRQSRDVDLEQSLSQELDRSSCAMDRGLAVDGTTPSQNAVRREQALVLAQVLDQLPKDYREVLVLRHLKGLKFADVARRMGRTTRSVEHLWARAVAEVRRRIGDDL